MSQVEESLKSTRFIHRILMLLCASVLASALYPSEEKDYSGAIDEIDAIVKIDLDRFINSSLQQKKSLAKGMDLVKVYQRAFDSALKYELEQEGFIYPPSQSLNHEVFLPAFDEYYVRSLLHSGTIQDYRDFISENIGIEYVFVQPEHIAKAFVPKIHELNIPETSKITGIKLVMSPPLYTKHKPKTFHLKMILILAVLKPKVKPNVGSYLAVVEDPPVSLTSTFKETQFQDWLVKEKLLDRLVAHKKPDARHHTAESIFPHLRSVWSLVANKIPEEAKRILLAEVDKNHRSISFHGVEIDSSMVVVAGPLLAVMLFMYFLSNLGHLQRIYHNNTESFFTFPWLPLFPDRISLTVSFISILLLPFVALGLLVVRFRHIDVIPLCVAVLLSIVSVVSAYFSWCRIFALRKVCKQEKMPELKNKQKSNN